MRHLSVLPALLLAVSTASAQAAPFIRYTAESNVGAFAIVPSRTQLVTIPAGRSLPAGVSAIITGDSTTARSEYKVATLYGQEASMFWWGRAYNIRNGTSTEAGTTTSTSYTSVTQGPTTALVEFDGQATGTMAINFGGRMTGQGSHATVAIDIDANGSVEYAWSVPNGAQTREIPFSVSGKRRIRVTTDCRAFTTAIGPSSSGYELSLRLTFKPFPAKVTPYGTGCGPQLSGSASQSGLKQSITLRTDNAIPSSPLVYGFGFSATNQPIPGSGCPLLTLPFVTSAQATGGTGASVLSIPVTGFYVGSVFAQAFQLDVPAGTIRSSNGVEVAFAP